MRQSIQLSNASINTAKVRHLELGGNPINGTAGKPLATSVTFTIGTESVAHKRIITGALKDGSGAVIATARQVMLIVSDAATGIGNTAQSPTSALESGEGVLNAALTANKVLMITTKADGTFQLGITLAAAVSLYLAVVMPDAHLEVSGALTFTAAG